MSLVETIYQKSLDLPPDKAQQVINFIDAIKAQPPIAPQSAHPAKTQPERPTFSQRWRGKLDIGKFSPEALEADPRLAYLAERYKL